MVLLPISRIKWRVYRNKDDLALCQYFQPMQQTGLGFGLGNVSVKQKCSKDREGLAICQVFSNRNKEGLSL